MLHWGWHASGLPFAVAFLPFVVAFLHFDVSCTRSSVRYSTLQKTVHTRWLGQTYLSLWLGSVLQSRKGQTPTFLSSLWLSARLYPSLIAFQRGPVTLQVVVHTSDVPGAGTGGGVWVDLEGLVGSSGPQDLPSDPLAFERGQVSAKQTFSSHAVLLCHANQPTSAQ